MYIKQLISLPGFRPVWALLSLISSCLPPLSLAAAENNPAVDAGYANGEEK